MTMHKPSSLEGKTELTTLGRNLPELQPEGREGRQVSFG